MHERQRRMYQARGEKSKNAMYYGAGSVSLSWSLCNRPFHVLISRSDPSCFWPSE